MSNSSPNEQESSDSVFMQFLRYIEEVLPKIFCIFDDIPFLLMDKTGVVGPFLLVGAGFLIFPLQIFLTIRDLYTLHDEHKTGKAPANLLSRIVSNVGKISLAVVGLAATSALLAFILVSFPVLAAGCSIAIPAIMAAIGLVELAFGIHVLRKAKSVFKSEATPDNRYAVTNAARGVIFSSVFFGFGLAITALATLGVLGGLGVVSFGIIPSVVLITVVVTALVLKIFQLVDEKKGYYFTNKIHALWSGKSSESKAGYTSDLGNRRSFQSSNKSIEGTLRSSGAKSRSYSSSAQSDSDSSSETTNHQQVGYHETAHQDFDRKSGSSLLQDDYQVRRPRIGSSGSGE